MSAQLVPELFHEIAHPGCASVRRYLTERGWQHWVKLRNTAYSEVKSDFELRGATRVPALYDGNRVVEGERGVLERLEELFGSLDRG